MTEEDLKVGETYDGVIGGEAEILVVDNGYVVVWESSLSYWYSGR